MLASVWSGETIDADKIAAYTWALDDVTYAAVEAAAKVHLRRGKFFPKPAELLEIIAAETVPEIGPGEAWAEVQRCINSRHDHPYSHPAIGMAVRMVGWDRLCMDEMKYTKPAFYKALDAAMVRLRHETQDGSAALGAGSLYAIASNGQDDDDPWRVTG
jgi:hypothetical protein